MAEPLAELIACARELVEVVRADVRGDVEDFAPPGGTVEDIDNRYVYDELKKKLALAERTEAAIAEAWTGRQVL